MATGTNGIATEGEAKIKLGYNGSVDTNKCCTKARAVAMGADSSRLTSYTDNQSVKYSDIYKKGTEISLLNIYVRGGLLNTEFKFKAYVDGIPTEEVTINRTTSGTEILNFSDGKPIVATEATIKFEITFLSGTRPSSGTYIALQCGSLYPAFLECGDISYGTKYTSAEGSCDTSNYYELYY